VKEEFILQFADFRSLDMVKTLSDKLRREIVEILITDLDDSKGKVIKVPWDKESYSVDDILHHIIAHKIHHIGQ